MGHAVVETGNSDRGHSKSKVCSYILRQMIPPPPPPPIVCMYISCVGLCVHVFMNPMPS